VAELAQYLTDHELRVHVVGPEDTEIERVSTIEEAQPGDITFLANRKYIRLIDQTQASAIILPETVSGPDRLVQLKVDDSYYAFMLIMELIYGARKTPFAGIDPGAKVHETAEIGPNAKIANNVTICRDVTIGENAAIYPCCFIGPRCRIGNNVILFPNVVIYDDTVIGNNVIIHGGTVVGQDGFGYATHNGVHHKIPQIGNVVIEDDVEIGANCAIDRATMGSTVIGQGTKFSDLIAIGHGTKIGPHCLLVAQVGVAGSAKLGRHVTLGGQAGVVGHITVGNNVTVAAKAGITKNVDDGQTLLGQPALPIQDAKKQILMTGKLPEMRDQLKRLQKRLDQLERTLTENDGSDHPTGRPGRS